VVGLVGFAASIVFFVLGRRTEERIQDLLEKINAAIQNWQGQIMNSSIELLESRVEIVGKRVALEEAKAKQAFLAELSARIKFLVEGLPPEKFMPAQSHQLEVLLKTFESATKGSLSSEALERIIFKGDEQQ
ncbi:MAG: hypothetical protein U1D36_02415, partial [Hydrogenophaga sp.]